MKKNYLIASLVGAGLLGAAGYGLFKLGMKQGATAAALPDTGNQSASPAAGPQSAAQGEDATRQHISAGLKAGDTDPATGTKILYYQVAPAIHPHPA